MDELALAIDKVAILCSYKLIQNIATSCATLLHVAVDLRPCQHCGRSMSFSWRLVWLLLSLGEAQNQLNATTVCTYPRPCDTFLSDDLPCLTLEYARVFDYAQREDVCALVTASHANDPQYVLSSGVANSRCIADWRGDGRCVDSCELLKRDLYYYLYMIYLGATQ
eukprot:s1579_g6.t1